MLRMISFPWHQNAFGGVSSGGGGFVSSGKNQHVFLDKKSYPQIVRTIRTRNPHHVS
jgi:hypothetical protein